MSPHQIEEFCYSNYQRLLAFEETETSPITLQLTKTLILRIEELSKIILLVDEN